MPQQQYDPYASHLPALSVVLGRLGHSIRSVLEVGCGFYSTPLFRSFCAAKEMGEHVILESDGQWRKRVSSLFDVEVRLFDGDALPDDVQQRHWDLAFIDCAVESSRGQHALNLHGQADVIVLHDSNHDWDIAYEYSAIIPLWSHAYHFTETYPHTLVLTDSDDIWTALGLERLNQRSATHGH